MENIAPIYVPALRLKQGEYRALRRLARDVADKIVPRLVVPPPKDVDPEKGRLLTKDEIVYGTGRRVATYWPMREALLDVQFLFDEFGRDDSAHWLPRIFDVARESGAKLVPIITTSDALGASAASFRKTINYSDGAQLAIRVNSNEVDSSLRSRLSATIHAMGVKPERCTILADFADADFSSPEIVAPVAQGALESLQEVALWGRVAFQGTNFPAKNPAKENGTYSVARNEWLAWKDAVSFDSNTAEHLIFGDYCADSAEFNFSKAKGGIPIRHYRYTTAESWLVIRGSRSGLTEAVMKDVCQRILSSGQFAGRVFSSADDYIYKTAMGWDGPGGGSTWREINTAHHIAWVVREVGEIKGIKFANLSVADPADQMSLL